MLIQGLGLLVLSAILCQILTWIVRQRAEIRAVDDIATGELVYLRRLTEEAEARAKTQIERTNRVWAGWRKFSVLAVTDETEFVKSFYLTPHDKKKLPVFSPGQHVTIQVKPSNRQEPLIRCYSLSCAPNDQYYRISVKLEEPRLEKSDQHPGLMSTYLHNFLKEGDFINLKSPSGTFSLDLSQHTPVVLIGGGIGMTPVFSMLESIITQKSNREVWFFAGMRNRFEHPMRVQLEAYAERHENLHLIVCYSDPSADCRLGQDYQQQGFISTDLLRSTLPSNNYDFYFCGPPGMMESLHQDLSSWGIPANRLHYETFGPATVGKSGRSPDVPNESDCFQVEFLRSKKTVQWTAADGSLLDLADRHEIHVESGCRSGNCGTCITAIRHGEVDYPIQLGEKPEDGTCLLCTAMPRSNLELDA